VAAQAKVSFSSVAGVADPGAALSIPEETKNRKRYSWMIKIYTMAPDVIGVRVLEKNW
jgi:hypothetical protein